MDRRDPTRSAWCIPAIVWAAGLLVLVMLGFGTRTQCTTTRPERECSGVDQWVWFGVIAAGFVALSPVSRSLREQATPWQVAAVVGVVIGASAIGTMAN